MLKHGEKSLKGLSVAKVCGKIMQAGVAQQLDQHMLIAETLWDSDGRHVLFTQNEGLIDSVLHSKFSLSEDARLCLPYSTFILAMPKGFKVNGVTIPSALVSYYDHAKRKERFNCALNLMGVGDGEHNEGHLKGLDSLSLFYQEPGAEKGVITQVTQTPFQVSGALSANNADEFAQILGEMPKEHVSPIAQDITDNDRVIQYVLTKIIAGISAIISAGEEHIIKDGLPNSGRVHLDHIKTDQRYSYSYINAPSNIYEDDKIGVRRFHLRQLRHEKYYQNQYQNMPSGSRWVFVRESQIGDYNAQHIV